MSEHIENKSVGILTGFKVGNYGTRIDFFEIVNEFFSSMLADIIPYQSKSPDMATVWASWRFYLKDSLIKYIAKKGVNNLLNIFIPKQYLDMMVGFKYIGDGLLNVIVGVITKKLMDIVDLDSFVWGDWMLEIVTEIKTEIIKQVLNMGYDIIL